MGGKKNIVVKVSRRNRITDGYMITPNDLFRGDGIYADLSPHERILLGAGLTCTDGYETTMERIEGWVEDLGRDRQEAARRRLRELGFLSMSQERFPAGDERAGEFYWAFAFFMDPLPPDERDKLPAKKSPEEKKRRAVAARTTPVSSGHERDHDDSAGQSTPVSSGHGRSGPDGQGGTPIYKKNQGKKNPPPAPAVTSGSDRPAANPEEEEAPAADNPQAAVVVEVHAKRTDWTPETIAEALTTAMSAGLGSLDYCRTVMLDLADGTKYGITRSPRRISERGPWWNAAPPPQVPRQQGNGERCDIYGHEFEWADDCKACITEAKLRKLGRVDEVVVTDEERERLAAVVAAARNGGRVPASVGALP